MKYKEKCKRKKKKRRTRQNDLDCKIYPFVSHLALGITIRCGDIGREKSGNASLEPGLGIY